MSLNIVFAGTPLFSDYILKALLDTQHSIVAVYTQADRPKGRGQKLNISPVKQTALQHNIPVYQPLTLKSIQEQTILKQLQPDVIIVAAYGLILPAAILTIPKYGCINVHVSLLPKWRGAAPIQRAILAGDSETGISIMQMDQGLDTGDILNIKSCPIHSTDTSETVHNRLADIGGKALIQTLKELEANALHPQKQDPTVASYAPKITKEEALIDWTQSASVLDCKIRAFNPWPVAFTYLDKELIRIWKAVPLKLTSNTLPGTIIEAHQENLLVTTGNGILKILELQLAGGKRLSVKEILNSKGTLFQPGKRCDF